MGNSSRDGNTGSLYLSSEKLVCGSKVTLHATTDWFDLAVQATLRCLLNTTVQRVNSFIESVVNKAEVDTFLELSWFFDDPMDVANLISGSSAFSKSSLNIWKFSVHILLKPSLENFEHYFASVWNECNCAVLWTFFGIAFLWDWNENWPFPVLWPLLNFPNLLAYECSTLTATSFKIWN